VAVPFELVLLGFGFILVLIGSVVNKLNIFKTMGAILLIVLTVVILSNGISEIDNLSTMAIASVAFAIGFISLITDNFEKEEKENDIVEEVDDGRFHE